MESNRVTAWRGTGEEESIERPTRAAPHVSQAELPHLKQCLLHSDRVNGHRTRDQLRRTRCRIVQRMGGWSTVGSTKLMQLGFQTIKDLAAPTESKR